MTTALLLGWLVQAVLTVAAAFFGARAGFGRFRSEKAFTRRTEWQEATMAANHRLYLVAEQILKRVRDEMPSQDPGVDYSDVRLVDQEAAVLGKVALEARMQIGSALLYAEGETAAAAHVLDLVLDEAENRTVPRTYALQRIEFASVMLTRAMAREFRELHGWTPILLEADGYEAQLRRSYDRTVAAADAKTRRLLGCALATDPLEPKLPSDGGQARS